MAAVEEVVAPLRREVADLRAQLQARPAMLVSRREAAERLGVSLPTLDRYVRAGLVRAEKVRRRVMVDPTALTNGTALAARALHGLPIGGGQ